MVLHTSFHFLHYFYLFVYTLDADGKSIDSVKSGLGYTEEIIPDLHSSTEELNFHDLTESEIRRRRSKLQPQYAVLNKNTNYFVIFNYEILNSNILP